MKILILLTILALSLATFAQGPNTNINPPIQVQANNSNSYYQINNNVNVAGQQVYPPAPRQQGSGSGSIFGSGKTGTTPCTDCDKVKKAIKFSRAYSGSMSHKKTFGLNKRIKKFSGRMNIKMKKIFVRKYKAKTSHAFCFNWH